MGFVNKEIDIGDYKYEALFFAEREVSLKKFLYGFFVLWRLIKNRSAKGIWLLFDGALKRLRKEYPAPEEYEALLEETFGKTDTVRWGKVRVAYKGLSLLIEIAVLNQYNITSANIKNKIVIDAGANIGVFSAFAAKLGARRVYAFEPVRENFELLKKTIVLNGVGKIVVPINKALGENDGKAKYHILLLGIVKRRLSFLTLKRKLNLLMLFLSMSL